MKMNARQPDLSLASEATASRPPATLLPGVRTAISRRVPAYRDLTKFRLSLLVLAVTAVGFVLGTAGQLDVSLLLHTLAGTGLVAFGANALNQVIEREQDLLMSRTRGRPIPAGRLDVTEAAAFGVSAAVVGLVYLYLLAGTPAMMLAAATIALYLFAYTPLKRRTPLNTLVGAVPGAIPPMIGYVAASGRVDEVAWWMFAIVFAWQLPHFYAISWIHRADYAAAQYRMLSTVDPSGKTLACHTVVSSAALFGVGLLPRLVGFAGNTYLWGACVLGLAMFGTALWFSVRLSDSAGRVLFAASLIFLPAIMAMMMLDQAVGRHL